MMNINSQIMSETTQQFSQNDEVEGNSGQVALTMGAFSIVLLVIVSVILSMLRYFFN